MMDSLSGRTVLIAEDERPLRMLIRVVFETAGATVIEAENGSTAMRMLVLHPEVDLICTDINMPQVDGYGLAASARGSKPEIGIIACSALEARVIRERSGTTIDGVVQKPFVPSDLIQAAHAAIRSRAGASAIAG